jgi:hypothetical protein
MKDIIVDNKNVYNFLLYALYIIKILTYTTVALFFVGFFNDKPRIYMNFIFVVKFLMGMFLIYRFNSYRTNKVNFTELDRKICYSCGLYIVVISFGEYINIVTNDFRSMFLKTLHAQFNS